MSDPETDPTIENVLPEWRRRRHLQYGWEEGAWEASDADRAAGIMVAMPGGMACPWCGVGFHRHDGSFVGVCRRNSRHRVRLVPWGG